MNKDLNIPYSGCDGKILEGKITVTKLN